MDSVPRVRDDFTVAVKATLAKRVAYVCSNPNCRAVTTGPGSEADTTVNLGVAAHITAASPGGPRYDESLSATERAAPANGIWLCQTCGKLVDADVPGYSVELLCRWKAETEERARLMLGAAHGSISEPLDLALPFANADDFLLSYTNTTLDAIGREQELADLVAFLDDGRPFCWWLWTGPAGVGKSRLALELCHATSADWHAGFLRERDQDRLATLRPLVPTLVVVDYAAQRSAWLSDTLLEIAQHHRGAKLRILVLEREASGAWWDTVQRHHRLGEAPAVAASMYRFPAKLPGLSPEGLRALIAALAKHLGTVLTKTQIEDIADHAHDIDPGVTPLFALVATMDWLSDAMSADRDQALRRLIARTDAQLASHIGDPAATFRAKNVRFLGSLHGGLSIERYGALLDTDDPSPPTGLLPGIYDDVHAVELDNLLTGLVPDILGELSVLDRLAKAGMEGHAARTLRDLAWRWSASAYSAFVERAAADHRDHPRLVDLLDVEHIDAVLEWASLMVGVIPLLRHSDHPAATWILERLEEARSGSGAGTLDEPVATARFAFATLVLHDGDEQRANDLYSDVVATSHPSWNTHTHALNNRGATWQTLGRNDLAREDYTAVIESGLATDEIRAMSYNNRADTYDDEGDASSAIADRTAALELADTSFNRRYIALIRRARVLRSSGDEAGADADVEAILETDDIAVEQKMAARLERAKWRISDGSMEKAKLDLDAVLASNRNFESVEAEAARLIVEIAGVDQ
jgi:tetratricopeptide (TPR) repeat protein